MVAGLLVTAAWAGSMLALMVWVVGVTALAVCCLFDAVRVRMCRQQQLVGLYVQARTSLLRAVIYLAVYAAISLLVVGALYAAFGGSGGFLYEYDAALRNIIHHDPVP